MTSLDPRKNRESGSNTGLVIAVAAALVFMLGWDYFSPKQPLPQAVVEQRSENALAPTLPTSAGATSVEISKEQAVTAPRIPVESESFTGSISLAGAKLDDLVLNSYSVTLNGDEPFRVLSPEGGKRVQFFDAGFGSNQVSVPNARTVWQTSSEKLTASSPLVLTWNNGEGQEFTRTISISKDGYTLKVVDEVLNRASKDIQVNHYAQIHRADGLEKGGEGYEEEQSTFYNFIGPEAMVDGMKHEYEYEDIQSEKQISHTGAKGWMGVKSRYFLSALIPDQQATQNWQFRHNKLAGRDYYSVTLQDPTLTRVVSGGSYTKSYRVYVGPNKRQVMQEEGVGLEDSVDYGWYHIIALPIYSMLMFFQEWTGNFGVAIILSTIVLKIILLPLANKSYVSMARMKQLTPKMEALKARCGDNREMMGLEMMKLYREHKVNPASGCWPMLVQIPIFFAFYKVILISFEFRHAPFIGWINDLSAYDHFFVLPVLMGVSMWFQQKLNPPIADPVQRQVMQALPIIFTVMFALFPSGLVLYWLVNNVLSIAQQWVITRRIENAGTAKPKAKA